MITYLLVRYRNKIGFCNKIDLLFKGGDYGDKKAGANSFKGCIGFNFKCFYGISSTRLLNSRYSRIQEINIIEKFKNNQMLFWGCFKEDKLVGVISTRNTNHICLLFVKKEFHKRGISKKLFNVVLNESIVNENNEITVNSSSYATDIYHHLGFTDIDKEQIIDGICFTPMKYIINSTRTYNY